LIHACDHRVQAGDLRIEVLYLVIKPLNASLVSRYPAFKQGNSIFIFAVFIFNPLDTLLYLFNVQFERLIK